MAFEFGDDIGDRSSATGAVLGGLKRTGLGRAQSAVAQRRPGGSRSKWSDAGAQRRTRGVGGKRSAQRSGGSGAGTGAPQAGAVGAGQSVTRPEVERRPTASVQASPNSATVGDRAKRRPAGRASARALRAPGLHGPGRRERSDRSRRPKRSERARRPAAAWASVSAPGTAAVEAFAAACRAQRGHAGLDRRSPTGRERSVSEVETRRRRRGCSRSAASCAIPRALATAGGDGAYRTERKRRRMQGSCSAPRSPRRSAGARRAAWLRVVPRERTRAARHQSSSASASLYQRRVLRAVCWLSWSRNLPCRTSL
jgi:hypothetical protein